MFNKLKSVVGSSVSNTITSTVYSTGNMISGVLPGNPVTREYEVGCHTGSAGPGQLWKIYSGTKKTTRQPASIFVLERGQLERWERQERELIWELLKKAVGQLTRLRHPQLLTVQHPLEESRDCLAFATEPVFASLGNIMGDHSNLPSLVPDQLRGYTLYDVEIKYGLLQLAEGLAFLHSGPRLLHRNLSPESVVINSAGAWKICGLEYCIADSAAPGQPPTWQFPEYDHSLPAESYPHLDYLAPEYALLGTVTPAADLYSLGMLALAVYNKKPLFQTNRNWGTFRRQAAELKSLPSARLEAVPAALRDSLKLLLSLTPDLRPSPDQLRQLPHFQDVGVAALTNLDQQFQWDNLQKSQFYKGLPSLLPQLPARVCLHRVFPCLAKEFLNPDMVPFVLPSSLQIAEQASKDDYVQHILPSLKPVMKMLEPIQILLIFMQRMELLLDRTPPDDVKSDVLPMVYRALESNVCQIQELCLSIIPSFAGLLDRQSVKTSLLPRIRNVCDRTSLLSVRVNSLICVGKLLDHMEKWQVIDDVLPWLPQVPSKEPAVIMAIVGIYKLAFSNAKLGLTKEVIAHKVLPFLIPLSIENGLTVKQYDSITSLVREMLTRLETEHRTKLEQLNSIKETQKSSLKVSMAEGQLLPAGQLVAAPSSQESSAMDNMFSGLGLGDFVTADKKGAVTKLMVGENNNQPAAAPQGSLGQSGAAAVGNLSLVEKQRLVAEQEAARSRAQQSHSTVLETPFLTKSVSMNQMAGGSSVAASMFPQTPISMTPSQPALFRPSTQHTSSHQYSVPTGQAQAKPDLSALDNLFGANPSSRPVVGAAGLGGGLLQPMASRTQATPRLPGGANFKQLSHNEINDLLG